MSNKGCTADGAFSADEACIAAGPAHRCGMRPARTPPQIDAAALDDAALAHLARYAATEAGLRRVLQRRVDRWAAAQPDAEAAAPVLEAARQAIDAVVARLVGLGALSDAGFAETRARSLVRSGRSRRAVQASLVAKGVAPDLARAAVGDDAAAELAAALVLARKRRIGPYSAKAAVDPKAARQKALGVLARAGFGRDTAERALAMDQEEAEARIQALRTDATGQNGTGPSGRPSMVPSLSPDWMLPGCYRVATRNTGPDLK